MPIVLIGNLSWGVWSTLCRVEGAENGGRTSAGWDPLSSPGVSAPAVSDLRF